MGNLLSIGKSGLLAAQVGLSTTGNNITNASVAGYNRQQAVQADNPSQNQGYGFIGNGTNVAQIKRYYDDFLNSQLLTSQSSQAQTNTYSTQIAAVDNLLSDTTAGLSPALQSFFNGVQSADADPSSVASRQALLSSANSLASRFQGMAAQLNDMATGVNTQIVSTVNQINTYAAQIGQLNSQIANAFTDPLNPPNDLLDQRDQAINELNKLIKVTTQPTSNHMLSVSIGAGQPLVVGSVPLPLATGNSPTDVSQVVVGYQSKSGGINPLPDNILAGGALGGLLQFRDGALQQAQNGLGQIAAGVASAFNAQHALGQDLNGQPGGAFFGPINAYVGTNTHNLASSTATVSATVVDASGLTTSDYSVDFDGTNFSVKRTDGSAPPVILTFPQTTGPQVVDGVAYTLSGTPATGDNFLVRPTLNAASDIAVTLTDPTKIALATPIVTTAPLTNTGKGKISAGTIDNNYLTPGNTLTGTGVTLTYDKTSNTFAATAGTPPAPIAQDVTVVGLNGVSTVYPAGTPIPYTDGDKLSFGGVNFQITGQPGDKDTFGIAPNSAGVGDSRNGALLAGLQGKNIMAGNKATFQTTYAQLVNLIGNKSSEAQIASKADDAAVQAATNAQQSVSGVNLDEEAANLLQYQQAYQASGKVMQIASQLFDVLLNLSTG
ncbi:flagellar hook-associated protein FlgK [Rugamonas sp.]|uniref:flagellar hook-associated protein FlgK n=1 Tax=Rugamonas sp. TaxID=1926287 RepID=UPI0025D62622|nr:flagellar hook-associated protein FlgK [Rugamonas sp.]